MSEREKEIFAQVIMSEREKEIFAQVIMSEREKEIFAQVIEYGKKYHVQKIILFGSRARRSHREKSDIDLAVYGCEDFNNFYFDIQEKVWTLLEFDIINMDEKVSEELVCEIERDGVVLYEEIR